MKKEFIEKIFDNWDVLYYDLGDFIIDVNTVPKLDKKFIGEFIENNNLDGENVRIEISTNEDEIFFFIFNVIDSYHQYLKSNGYSLVSKYTK